jgi:6-phospho-beta-glucosidase
MSDRIKLAVLGGSSVAAPELIRALAACQPPDGRPVEIVLLGRTAAKLAAVAAVCARLAAQSTLPITVRHDTNLARGLEGAGYVLNQVRVGGYAARAYDESFPQAFGIPGEETWGPGGMNNARRTIPVTLEHCRLIEAVAPDALLINLTNPSSFIQYAVAHYTRVNVLGVCDSPVGLAHRIAALLGAPPAELWVGYVGMHHFGWVTEVRWNGRDALPEVLARVDQMPGLAVDPDLARAIGAIPTSYFKYYYHPERILAQQRGQPVRAEALLALEARLLTEYADPALVGLPESLEERGAHWYQAIVVPVLLAHAYDTRAVHTLNVSNGQALPWLPPGAIVELPVVVARHGLVPLAPPPVPADLRGLLAHNAACEMLWVEAVVERSYQKALRAMRLNHLVPNSEVARGILREIWEGSDR